MWQIYYYAMCRNLELSLIIMMDDGDQYFDFFNVKKSS
jgi:hypothetical protein